MHRGAGRGDRQALPRAPRKQGLRAGRHTGGRRHRKVSGGGENPDKAGSGREVRELARTYPRRAGSTGWTGPLLVL